MSVRTYRWIYKSPEKHKTCNNCYSFNLRSRKSCHHCGGTKWQDESIENRVQRFTLASKDHSQVRVINGVTIPWKEYLRRTLAV